MSNRNDDELRARFGALRDRDRRTAPEFGEIVKAAESGSRRTRRKPVGPTKWLVAAASIVIAALLLAQLRNRGQIPGGVVAVSAITNWQSPTAGLLQTPARDLLSPRPLLSSVFDGITTTAVQPITD